MQLSSAVLLSLLASTVACGCKTKPAAAAAGIPLRFDGRSLGAAGDGRTKDTAAFQMALDACAAGGAGGGGEVIVPAGNYLIGSIELGSNTTLRLQSGATLTASPDLPDYP